MKTIWENVFYCCTIKEISKYLPAIIVQHEPFIIFSKEAKNYAYKRKGKRCIVKEKETKSKYT